MRDVIAELRTKPSVSLPVAGKALADLSRNGSYRVAARGEFPIPVYEIGGKKRCASAPILRLLGLADDLQPTP
jgi:hypothetical protein